MPGVRQLTTARKRRHNSPNCSYLFLAYRVLGAAKLEQASPDVTMWVGRSALWVYPECGSIPRQHGPRRRRTWGDDGVDAFRVDRNGPHTASRASPLPAKSNAGWYHHFPRQRCRSSNCPTPHGDGKWSHCAYVTNCCRHSARSCPLDPRHRRHCPSCPTPHRDAHRCRCSCSTRRCRYSGGSCPLARPGSPKIWQKCFLIKKSLLG